MGAKSRGAGSEILKPVGYAVAVLLFAAFDSTVSPRIGLLGTTPSLCLALTASAAVFDGKKVGAVVGLAAGVASHALGGVGISLLPIVFTLLGWFSASREHGIPGRDSVDRSFPYRLGNFAACLAVCCGVGAVTTAVCMFLTVGRFNIFSAALRLLLPEAVGSFLYGFPIGLVRIVARRSVNAKGDR